MQKSIVEILRQRADDQSENKAFTFLNDSCQESDSCTYGELDRKIKIVAGFLQSVAKINDRALLFFQPGLDYIVNFFGCLYAGVIAVPSYPPKIRRNDLRLETMIKDCGASLVLTNESILTKMTPVFDDKPDLKKMLWVDYASIEGRDREVYRPLRIDPGDTAYLQYTSGSTSAPRGAIITHGNLISNSSAIHDNFGHSGKSSGVIWLPPYHDMGLIGGIIQPVYAGFPVALMSPFTFLQKPFAWLKAVSDYRATTSGGPNFAYDLCVQKITAEERGELDLSAWEVAFNGAEPIRRETLERFSQAFAPCGFKKEAFHPCYGLAEATLLVTSKTKGAPYSTVTIDANELTRHQVRICAGDAPGSKILIGSGTNYSRGEIRIVNPETCEPCGDSRIGEVWLAGPCVATGYWQNAALTQETFGGRLSSGDGSYLRTGDLAFLRSGELFITGRIKDLIIIRGRNYYPHDVELIIEKSHPAFQPSAGAVFSCEVNGEEKMIGVFEIKKDFIKTDFEEIARQARRVIAGEMDLRLHSLIFIRTMSIPKTSSGKIQRRLCRKKYLENDLLEIGRSVLDGESAETVEPENPLGECDAGETDDRAITAVLATAGGEEDRRKLLEGFLRKTAAAVLKMDEGRIDARENLQAYGLDSLMTVELSHRLERILGVQFSLTEMGNGLSVKELGEKIIDRLEKAGPDAAASDESVSLPNEMPLSYGQRSLWFIQNLAPDNSAYNLAYAVVSRVPLDKTALALAFSAMIQKHASLRTRFLMRDDSVVQKIEEQVVFQVRELDVRNHSQEDCRLELIEKANLPFRLDEAPLFRVYWGERPGNETVVLLVMHHIITDFWSLALLGKEWGEFYRLCVETHSAPHVREAGSYLRFVQWQKNYLEANPQLEEFWKKELGGELPLIDLTTDFPRPAVQTYRGDSIFFEMDEAVRAKITAGCRRFQCTPYVFLLAAFFALLHRLTGQTDLIVGSPTAGRRHARFSATIGYFVNPVTVRVLLEENDRFDQFVEKVRTTVARVLEHQSYPFELLVEKLHLARDLRRSPLFQIMFVYQRAPIEGMAALTDFALYEKEAEIEFAGAAAKILPLGCQSSPFDLTLIAAETSGEPAFTFQFNTDLFKKETIRRMSEEFKVLLASFCNDPDRPIATADILPDPEKRKILSAWNATAADYRNVPFFVSFEEEVRKRPRAQAVIQGGAVFSYDELNRRANRIAHFLRARGVTIGSIVPVFLTRSDNLIAALLGIAKAQCSYLPLDPAYPAERISFILEDVFPEDAAGLVVTESSLAAKISSPRARTICLDVEQEALLRESDADPGLAVDGETPAYVIYTSGSTGRPKGVRVPHRGVANFLSSMRKRPGLTEADRLLAITTISFDIAVLEIFLPLTTGAAVILTDQTTVLDGRALALEMEKNGATVMQATPSVWKLLLDSGWRGNDRLTALCGGEAFPPSLGRQLLPKVRAVWNMYGPTETTVWSTIHKVEWEESSIPIGRPIDNTRVYILDKHFQPVPVGVAGELYIGGDGVAGGYYRRPELTAARFVPDPFVREGEDAGVRGAMLYMTGDLARYRPDGIIEYLGRNDFQVKVRGHRIEIGEIEHVLDAHPAVGEALVVAREDASGEKRLTAYCVRRDPALRSHDLFQFLKEKLPDYMIPSFFHFLPQFPRTPNGKIDRQALPVPDAQRPELNEAYVPARGAVQEKIAALWREVLEIDKVGMNDNFFELGGHSLLAARIHEKLRSELTGKDLTLVALFQYPTIASLARYLSDGQADASALAADEEHLAARKARNDNMNRQREERRRQRMREPN